MKMSTRTTMTPRARTPEIHVTSVELARKKSLLTIINPDTIIRRAAKMIAAQTSGPLIIGR